MELGTVLAFFSGAASGAIIKHFSDAFAFKRQGKRAHYEAMKALYAECWASYERCIRHTEELKDYRQIIEELPILNARLALLSTKAINEQSERVGNALYRWSSAYRQAMPTIGEGMVSFTPVKQQQNREIAEELYPKLLREIGDLTEMMKTHLESIKA